MSYHVRYPCYGTAHRVLEWLSGRNFLNYDVFMFLKVVLILANSTDPDVMQHFAVLHLGSAVCQRYHSEVPSIQRVKTYTI